MTRLFLFLLSTCSLLNAQAQSGFKIGYIHPKTGLPGSITFTQTETAPNEENLGLWFRNNLNTGNDFELRFYQSETDKTGIRHIRFKQYYQNIRVEGGDIILHMRGKKALSVNGRYVPNLKLSVSPAIDQSQALATSLALFGNAVFAWEDASMETLIKRINQNPNASYKPEPELIILADDSMKAANCKLVYKTDVFVLRPYNREFVYIDAQSGDVNKRISRICNIDVQGSAHTRYHGIQTITCDSIDEDSFLLRESGRGKGIETWDMNKISPNDSLRLFSDSDNIWNNINARKDEVATDVHWSSEKTFDFYVERFNKYSYSPDTGMIVSFVHFGDSFNNAFWNGSAAHYGDGDGLKMNPLTSVDIVAHELTHGFTQYSCNLNYYGEPGALNESFSDIFGKAVEHHYDSASFTWNVAQKIVTDTTKPFRDMSNPKRRKAPQYYYGEFYEKTSFDNGGVHINSGIQNYWFYLLVNGGSGQREDAEKNPFSVDALGWDKALDIAFTNQTYYLYEFSDFSDAAYLCNDVCSQLYPGSNAEIRQVNNAWYAVGVIEKTSVQSFYKTAGLWSLFPNPGEGLVSVKHPLGLTDVECIVSDISGKTIKATRLSSGDVLDLRELSQGVYLINIGGQTYKWVRN